MVIIELIGSLSIAIVFVSIMTLTIIHMRNKQNDVIYIHDHLKNDIERSNMKMNHVYEENKLESILPFQEFNHTIPIPSSSNTTVNRKLSIINVIDPEQTSVSSIKYGIQWKISTDEDIQSEPIHSSLTNLQNSSEYDQTDSLSFGDQTICVRNLIEKFENTPIEKRSDQEKMKSIEPDLTSIDTNLDSQTIQTDRNQNQQKISHHSSISHLDVTIPSNLSSSIDLEQFECFSTTSNLSEFLNIN